MLGLPNEDVVETWANRPKTTSSRTKLGRDGWPTLPPRSARMGAGIKMDKGVRGKGTGRLPISLVLLQRWRPRRPKLQLSPRRNLIQTRRSRAEPELNNSVRVEAYVGYSFHLRCGLASLFSVPRFPFAPGQTLQYTGFNPIFLYSLPIHVFFFKGHSRRSSL